MQKERKYRSQFQSEDNWKAGKHYIVYRTDPQEKIEETRSSNLRDIRGNSLG